MGTLWFLISGSKSGQVASDELEILCQSSLQNKEAFPKRKSCLWNWEITHICFWTWYNRITTMNPHGLWDLVVWYSCMAQAVIVSMYLKLGQPCCSSLFYWKTRKNLPSASSCLIKEKTLLIFELNLGTWPQDLGSSTPKRATLITKPGRGTWPEVPRLRYLERGNHDFQA